MINSGNTEKRLTALLDLFEGMSLNKPGKALYLKHKWAIDTALPSDIIAVVDGLIKKDIPMDKMKTGISKSLNLLHQTLSSLPIEETEKGGFLHTLIENNKILDEKLKALRPLIKRINQDPQNIRTLESLKTKIQEINQYPVVYQIKENLLFPILEKHWEDFRCVQIMWSIHDDIRRDLKNLIKLIEKIIKGNEVEEDEDLNSLLGDLFFAIYAIKFREEKILIPVILNTIGEKELNEAFKNTTDLTFPFYNVVQRPVMLANASTQSQNNFTLPTGNLTPEILHQVFQHLPIDITYVDADDCVQFFSDPPHRIFPRTTAVIGRKVQNCHPPESLHIVNQILESFKKGEENIAEFWIDFKDKKIQISYYAMRDEHNQYLGVLEVSQDITEIQKRKGEKRLL